MAAQFGTSRLSPTLGDKRVNEITSADVLECVEPLCWAVRPEMAARVRQRTAAVIELGVARGYRTDNPAGQIPCPRPTQTPTRKEPPPCAALQRCAQGTADGAGVVGHRCDMVGL